MKGEEDERVDKEEERVDTYSTVSIRPSGGLHMVDTCPLHFFAHFFAFFSFSFLLLFFSLVSFLSVFSSNLPSVHLNHTHTLPTLILITRLGSQPTFFFHLVRGINLTVE